VKQQIDQIISLFKSLTIFEVVLTAVVAVAIGVAFWGWTFVYEMAKPFLKASGLNYLTAGFWIFASIFLSKIVQKPGVAILASVIAAFVESLLTQWGLMSVLWGLLQGVGAEIVFLLFLYRKWDLKVLMLASLASTLASFSLDYVMYDYHARSVRLNLIQMISYALSSLFFAAYLSQSFARRLTRLGLLDQFLIAKEEI
jgi:energy-coupling factor transport system substrate-specific component